MQRRWILATLVLVAALLAFAAWSAGGRRAIAPRAMSTTANAVEGSELDRGRDVVGATPRKPRALEPIEAGHAGSQAAPEASKDSGQRFRIEGRVLGEDGEPIEGAEVVLQHDRSALATSDAEGFLRAEAEMTRLSGPGSLFDNLGWAYVDVVADGYAARSFEASARAGETLQLGVVRLVPGADIVGFVRDQQGDPIEDAQVSWRPAVDFPDDPARARLHGVATRTWPVPDAATRGDGSFVMRGAPAGDAFLVGWASGKHFAWTEPFTVVAGVRVERDLWLEDTGRRSWTIAGRVRSSDGHPLPGVLVFAREGFGRSEGETDAEGRFELTVYGESQTVEARDPEDRRYPARVEGVREGASDLELVMDAPIWREVRVVDTSGEPIAWSHIRCQGHDGPKRGELLSAGARGSVTILEPRTEFTIDAFAPGYRSETFGPYEPATSRDSEIERPAVVIKLIEGDAIRGRVVHRGRPIAGARIRVGATALKPARSIELTRIGRPLYYRRAQIDGRDATTDGSGKFVASLHNDGWHTIAVEAQGLPLTVFGPFEWSRPDGATGVELELQEGGAIEGRVLVAPGAAVAGRLIGVCNGWSFLRSAPVDADGSFRIDGLAPGDYQVRALVRPVSSLQALSIFRTLGDVQEVVSDCVVRSGKTTHVVLDLTEEGSVRLLGRFGWEDGTRTRYGAVQLAEPGSRDALASMNLATDGRFEFALSTGGPLTIHVFADNGRFRQDFDLVRGDNAWEAIVPFGQARLLIDWSVVDDDAETRCEWDDGAGLHWVSDPIFGRETETVLERVPAGTVRLTHGGEVWESFDVRAGAETVVDLR